MNPSRQQSVFRSAMSGPKR